MSYHVYGYLQFQSAEEPELPVASKSGLENAEKAIVPGDDVSPSSNAQLPSATVAPSTLVADNASTLASLRMVCPIVGLPCIFCVCCVMLHAHLFICVKRLYYDFFFFAFGKGEF